MACGKSTLGKAFLCEYSYEGKIQFAGRELQDMKEQERTGIAGYLGHDPELFYDSIKNNVLMGDEEDIEKYLKAVCIDEEVTGYTYRKRRYQTFRRTGTETGTCQNLMP